MNGMKDLLKAYEDRAPEIVFAWQDSETEAKGWVVINSLRGGAAGGGTRMRPGLDQREVESLAKTMEVKFTVSGPYIGGAKSGIDFDPSDPRKKGVLERWYKAVTPLLKHYYGTGGDLNVDEIHEVIPITESNGVWHPQEGVFTGHFQPNEAQKVRRIGNLRQGVSQPVEDDQISPDTSKKIRGRGPDHRLRRQRVCEALLRPDGSLRRRKACGGSGMGERRCRGGIVLGPCRGPRRGHH